MTDGTGALPVSYRGVKPDLLGYQAAGAYQDVVVEGRAPGAVQPPTPRAAGYRLIAFSTPKPPRRMPMIAPRRTKTLPPRWR